MTLNGHFPLNSLLRRYVWSYKPGFRSLQCSECCHRTLNRKEQLRRRAVSLRQHGFLALKCFPQLAVLKAVFSVLYKKNQLCELVSGNNITLTVIHRESKGGIIMIVREIGFISSIGPGTVQSH